MMRKNGISLIVVLILSSFSILAAQEWSDAIEIGTGATPDFDVDPATGNVHLIYNGSGGAIYTVISPEGAIISQENIDRAAGENSWGGYHYGPSIAFDPTTGMPHVLYRRHRGNYYFDVYYTYMQADGSWSLSLQLMENTYRAYAVRLEVDSKGVVHALAGKSDSDNDIFGSATYYRIVDGNINRKQENLDRYRADDRLEISIADDDILHILFNSPDQSYNGVAGGPVTYWRSFDGGVSLELVGDIHSSQAVNRNGNGDIFADQSGNVHFVYGSSVDQELNNDHALHYVRFENGEQVRDIIVTDENELGDWQHSLGKGSIAASDNGRYVVTTYNQADESALRSRLSSDGGESWSDYVTLAPVSGGADGREKESLKAWKTLFYVVYPADGKILFRNAQFEYAPEAVAGGPYIATEGDTITFDASGSSADGEKTVISYGWDWNNDGTVDESSEQPTTKRYFADDFVGTATLYVTDSGNLVGKTTFSITVNNALPVLSTGSPYTTTTQRATSISATATDAGVEDTHTFSWDLEGDGVFETPGAETQVIYADSGAYTVKVMVIDDDGGEAVADVIINVGNYRPILSEIPMQTIAEGETFADINLNLYVTHEKYAKSQLNWSLFGNNILQVSIADSVVSIAVPDSEWAGTEAISFVATDPEGNTDTTKTFFTVTPVNDPPQFSQVEEQSALVGENFAQLDLLDYISDAEQARETLIVSAGSASNFFIGIIGFNVTIAPLNSQWIGSEDVTFTVEDNEGASTSVTVTISVKENTGVSENLATVPDEFGLKLNYPNPFNPQTKIPFDLKEQSQVELTIYDITGHRLVSLVNGILPAGSHSVVWNAQTYSSGTYFVVMRVSNGSKQLYLAKQKMLLVR
ncbi:MAG: T9SS C-terminal target domain-containing protein [Calditrichaeota bacterium]|nr:MAG: T9SS C-terminal target domain-containing protein [Calditrichota bacterium]